MKKNNKNNTNMYISEINSSKFKEYNDLLIKTLIKMGATEQELSLVCDEIILNSIHNDRKVEDVAWAILQ